MTPEEFATALMDEFTVGEMWGSEGNPDFEYASLEEVAEFIVAQLHLHGDLALPTGHSGSSLTCPHPFCVAERNPPST